jgi:muconolactone D-isomerase
MADFLARIEIRLPADMPADQRAQLEAAERRRGRELMAARTLRHIWRIPGRTANIGVWSCRDATELHRALTSLPLFPWMDIEVTPLAVHPLTEGEG